MKMKRRNFLKTLVASIAVKLDPTLASTPTSAVHQSVDKTQPEPRQTFKYQPSFPPADQVAVGDLYLNRITDEFYVWNGESWDRVINR